MPLMTGSTGDDGSFNLQPVCVFGTDIQNDSNKETLAFSWTAFKWSSSASDALKTLKSDRGLISWGLVSVRAYFSLNSKVFFSFR